MRQGTMGGLLALLLISGCGETRSGGGAEIVATTGMIADAAREIVGSHRRVHALMGPGIDPHQYKASAGDLQRLQSARIILYNGLHLEGKMGDVFAQMRQRNRTFAVTSFLDPMRDLRKAEEGFEGAHDPHVWFDVRLWMKVVEAIRDELTALEPNWAEDYRTNAAAYLERLSALHEETRAKADSVPEAKRVLITAHDAFHYFGRAYGFEVHGLQGVSTATEPSTRDVQELAKLIGSRKIPAVFGETSVPERNVQAVVEAVQKDYGFKVRFVSEKLYSDALGPAESPAGTYIGMVRHNIDTIVEALR